MSTIKITTQQVNEAAANLARHLNTLKAGVFVTFSNGGLNAIAAVARNGLACKPVVLSIDPTCGLNNYNLLQFLCKPGEGKLFFFDDLLDTGRAVKSFEEDIFHTAHIPPSAFLFDKQGTHRIYTPDRVIRGKVLHTSEWLEFPWERNEY